MGVSVVQRINNGAFADLTVRSNSPTVYLLKIPALFITLSPKFNHRIKALHRGAAMASSDVQRKLTAIFSADVVGYSRLMGADEEANEDRTALKWAIA